MLIYGSAWIALTALLYSLVSGVPLDKEQGEDTGNEHFDYIILGGGTAGLVVASRLSEDPQVSVVVVEAGGFERFSPNVTNATALGVGKNTRLDWQYETIPQTFAGNRTITWSAGKGVGGSTLINGMTYIRPAHSQMDLWPSLGLELDWKKLFAFSKKGEHFEPPSQALTDVGASYEPSAHGYDGPLTTCISPHILAGDIHNVFNTTFQKLGIPPRHEFNGGNLRGFGIQQATQDPIADVREDAARAYYYPVMNRPNLVVMVNMTATRLLWGQDSPDGKAVAHAAEVLGQNGHISAIYANREIVISAGALRSPAVLEHSGIGNPSILSRHSVPVKVNLTAVGENLQDQTVLTIIANALHQYASGFPPFVAHTSLSDLFGPNTTSIYNSTLAKLPSYAAKIAASNNGASDASTQEHLLKTQLDLLLNSNTPASEIAPIVLDNFVGAVFWPLQPFSRGSVHINSTNTTAQPRIDPRFFEIDFDIDVSIATAKFVRRFFTTPPLVSLVNVTSFDPSFEVIPEGASDDVWLQWLKTTAYQPNYHHLGTCAMLPREMGGVVDNDFRVYGTDNVRVVDLSVVPSQVAGHSMSLLYGIAEWAAMKIRMG